MIKIHGPIEPRNAGAVKKSRRTKETFSPSATTASKAASASSSAAPAAMMGALIALQSDAGGNAKTFAAAQHTLDMLEQLQMTLLDGGASADNLEVLSRAASVRAHAAADSQLQQIYDEISLRARVELAKLGR